MATKLIEGVNADRRGGKLRPRTGSFGTTGTGSDFGPGMFTSRIQDFLGQARERLGLPGLEQAQQSAGNVVRGLQGQIEELPGQVKGETRGFDVNAAQLAAIQRQKQTPLVTQLSQAGRGLEATTQALGLASDRLAREQTGFTSALQADLDVLLTKMQQQGQLDFLEQQKLVSLALAESGFEQQKKLISFQESFKQPKTNPLDVLRGLSPASTPTQRSGGGSTGPINLQQEFEGFSPISLNTRGLLGQFGSFA